MSAHNARGFDTPIRTDDHFDLHLARDVHAPSKFRVERSDPGLYHTSPLRNRNTQQEKGTWDAMAASLEELAEDDEGKILSNRRIEG